MSLSREDALFYLRSEMFADGQNYFLGNQVIDKWLHGLDEPRLSVFDLGALQRIISETARAHWELENENNLERINKLYDEISNLRTILNAIAHPNGEEDEQTDSKETS